MCRGENAMAPEVDCIASRVVGLITAYLRETKRVRFVRAIAEDARFKDIGIDSLDKQDLGMSLEDAFDVEIPDDVAAGFERVSDPINYLKEKEREKLV